MGMGYRDMGMGIFFKRMLAWKKIQVKEYIQFQQLVRQQLDNKISIMSKFRAFTEESRDQILKALTNESTSKQAWSFSKQKRFVIPPPVCPYVAYNNNSTISNRKTSFGSERRKVFTEVNEGPSSWVYNPGNNAKNSTITFTVGRQEAIANSYIQRDPLKNPGPGRYSHSQTDNLRHGFTMRPKTPNHRNYFIEDKEMAAVPGPGHYQDDPSKMVGKNLISKFKSAILTSPMHTKSSRFPMTQSKTPSAWDYRKTQEINQMGKATGSIMGHEGRPAFTDKAARSSFTPGPGNYRLPTQFAHYKKIVADL